MLLLLLLPLLLRRRRPLSGVLTINSILWAHASALARNTRALGALTCGHRTATSEHSVDARALNRHSYTGSGQHTSSTTNTATHQKKHPKQYGNICAKCDGGGGHARHAEVLWRRQCARPWYREFVSDELAINVMLARTQTKRNKRKSCMRIKRVCAHSVWVAAMASTHTHMRRRIF